MQGNPSSYAEAYPATAESVRRARADLTEFVEHAGVGADRLEAIRLAASEAVTNAVLHAYHEEGSSGQVQVSASCIDRELWLLIDDTGSGFRAHSKRPGLGLGLALIAQLADDFQIHSRGTGGTELQMRFALDSPLGPASKGSGSAGQRRGSCSAAVSPASASFSTTR
jgi:anti-sigma regulatory factor (Ser/Thr protein kinase)